MCRTISKTGKEQSACVDCQSSCIDIDSERHFWQKIKGKRGLSWAWYSYPGLIIAFFKLMNGSNSLDLKTNSLPFIIKHNYWAYDNTLSSRIFLPLNDWLAIPRLIIPIALVIAGYFSYYLFTYLEKAS